MPPRRRNSPKPAKKTAPVVPSRDAAPAPSSLDTPLLPLPTPGAILNLRDIHDVRRAREAWKLASLLNEVFRRWRAWLDQLERTGHADPNLPCQWHEMATAYFIGLWHLHVNFGSLLGDANDSNELLKAILPIPPIPWENPNWSQDLEFRKQVRDHLCSQSAKQLYYDLRILLRTLEVSPLLAFVNSGDHRPAEENTPQQEADEPPTSKPVVLGGADDDVFVCGKKKAPLPPAQYKVVKALVEANEKGERVSKDSLYSRAKVDDPIGALKRLIRRDADWAGVIDMARLAGRGYGLRDCPPTSN
jgi:hypothetical protein